MYKRMLRSVLGTAFAAAALMLVAHGSTSDVGWGNAQAGAAVDHYQGDVGWGYVAPAASGDLHQSDVGWGNVAPAASGDLHQSDVGWGNSVENRADL